jgi:VIT1/CCC1 family predicted Fe2+/Mn2+ transporter
MSLAGRTNRLLEISGSGSIFRRYLVVNGFDGALTLLGLIIGFMVSSTTDLAVILNACLAAAIALGMSGIGGAPLLISLLIITPLWLAQSGWPLPGSPLHLAIGTAAVLIFVLGVLLGRIADVSWVRSGLRTVAIAAMTITLIYCFTG